jgi:hypothetical protein
MRRPYSAAEELALTTQVDGHCPFCGCALFYKKKNRTFKGYQLAHIYPLNPSPAESAVLATVERLSADVNDPDNIIPLCTNCHTRFDKPRTVEEYNELAAKKREGITRIAQLALFPTFPIEEDIRRVIEGLASADLSRDDDVELAYNAKSLNVKFDASLPIPTRQKIKHAVADYYQHIRREFREMERNTPNVSQLIFVQVKAFYLKQKSLNPSQLVIFVAIVEWIRFRANPQTLEAAEIVASFFVQNCEVFE